jgi:hypothetical protein
MAKHKREKPFARRVELGSRRMLAAQDAAIA